MFCGQFLPTSHYVWFLHNARPHSLSSYCGVFLSNTLQLPSIVTLFLGFLMFLSNTIQLLWLCFCDFSCFSATLSIYCDCVSGVSHVSQQHSPVTVTVFLGFLVFHSPCVFLGFLVFLVFLSNTLPGCFRGFLCFSALWFSLAVLTQLAPILSDIIITSSLLTNHIKF